MTEAPFGASFRPLGQGRESGPAVTGRQVSPLPNRTLQLFERAAPGGEQPARQKKREREGTLGNREVAHIRVIPAGIGGCAWRVPRRAGHACRGTDRYIERLRPLHPRPHPGGRYIESEEALHREHVSRESRSTPCAEEARG